jgi:hypothetical protein
MCTSKIYIIFSDVSEKRTSTKRQEMWPVLYQNDAMWARCLFDSLYFQFQFDWSILYFTPHSRIFLIYGDVTIAADGLQNIGLCSATRAFEQGGIFFLPHFLWNRTSFFRRHPKECPIFSLLTKRRGMFRTYSNPGFSRVNNRRRIQNSGPIFV